MSILHFPNDKLDTASVYDVNLGKTQAEINTAQQALNNGVDDIKTKVDAISSTTNLFSAADIAGTTLGITMTVEADGTLVFNGTSEGSVFFILPKPFMGTYTAKLTIVDQGSDTNGNISLRYCENSDFIGTKTTWVNPGTPQATVTFSSQQYIAIALGNSKKVTNLRVRFQIESGSSVGDYEAPTITAKDIIARSKIEGASTVRYVATNGNDSNTGMTDSAPFATISAALADSADVIYLAEGQYTENVDVSGRNLKIIGYGAVLNFDSTEVRTYRSTLRLFDGYYELIGIKVKVPSGVPDTTSCIHLRNASALLIDCAMEDAPNMGLRVQGGDVVAIRCTATGCGVDGFNGHEFNRGTSENPDWKSCSGTFIGCVATDCGDDGVSFHENSIMRVFGGEYANCTTSGITPHGNCNCEIHSAYIHNNGAGIEAKVGDVSDLPNGEMPDPLPTMVLTDCIIAGNTGNAVTTEHYIVKSAGNAAGDNGTNSIVDSSGSTITSYNISF